MTMIQSEGISRRGWLRWTAMLTAALAMPGRMWAAVARPEAAFGATAIDDALAAWVTRRCTRAVRRLILPRTVPLCPSGWKSIPGAAECLQSVGAG